MSTNHRLLIAMLTVAVLAPVAAVHAGTVLQEHSQGPVSYVSGGIGVDEADAIREAAAAYPLTLEMATAAGGPRDAYVANAKVDIRDAGGKIVLDTTTDGPLMLVNLPSGVYHVAVNWNGVQREKTVQVGGERRQHVLLEFPNVPGNN
jgi:hypothetical protein